MLLWKEIEKSQAMENLSHLRPSLTDENGFSILRSSGKTPVLAVCKLCQLKFFTPLEMMANGQEADYYLREKYRDHRCSAAQERRRRS
jgi:hypothetical protein